MSNKSSSKSQLFLMEFICVVMFFSLCVAVCISVFVKADNMSKDGSQLSEALIMAESVAESIKAMEAPSSEDMAKLSTEINKSYKGLYTVEVKDKFQKDMLTAEVYVYGTRNDEEEICNISVKKYLPGEVKYAETK